MRLLLICTILLSVASTPSSGQKGEFGGQLGFSGFLGDLGGANSAGTHFLKDIEPSLFRPAVGIFYRYNFSSRFAWKNTLTYTRVLGDDGLLDGSDPTSDQFYRWYRNLSFFSDIFEITSTIEFNILKFSIGNRRERFTPYIATGIGVFFMDPKAKFEGRNVRLQPLGTEGQGLPEYPDREPYSLTQLAIPLTFGFKLGISKNLALGFEITHRITFTDYMDDVSTSYVDPALFYLHKDVNTAMLAESLANRSYEVDPNGDYAGITDPGSGRGNPDRGDEYFMVLFSLSYSIVKSNFDCPTYR